MGQIWGLRETALNHLANLQKQGCLHLVSLQSCLTLKRAGAQSAASIFAWLPRRHTWHLNTGGDRAEDKHDCRTQKPHCSDCCMGETAWERQQTVSHIPMSACAMCRCGFKSGPGPSLGSKKTSKNVTKEMAALRWTVLPWSPSQCEWRHCCKQISLSCSAGILHETCGADVSGVTAVSASA